MSADLSCLCDKVVCCVTLSRNNNYNVIAFFVGVGYNFCNVHDTLCVGDRAAAEFLNYKSHDQFTTLYFNN